MTLEELQQSVNKDFKLDDTELDRESVNIPLLHNKYLIHYNKFNLLRKKADQDHKTLIRENGNTTQVKQTLVCIKQNLLI